MSLKMHLPPLDVSVYPVVTMAHGRYGGSGRPAPTSSNVPNSPDFSSVQKLVRHVLRSSRVTVQQVERLQGRLHQVYLVRIADGGMLMLKCPPPFNTRLLRHEQRGIDTEAKIVELLAANTQLPVPHCIRHDPQGGSFGSPYLMLSYIPGIALAEIAPRLSPSERRVVDHTLGAYVRNIASLTAPRFGTTHRVLSGTGSATWREAFLSLLESVLRDAEDMLVSIPYDSIRYYVAWHGYLLEEITQARLVPLDVGGPENVLVDDCTRQVCGLLGFSNAIWGDPMMAAVFTNASEAFYEGYGECPARTGPAHVRQLLYSVYRAVVAVVTHHYRPQYANHELEARRSLTWALNQLSQV
ncbi:hypothetical protein AOQ84DRAFT_171479 [Glonium stellatum]|uniref:Aminoglycoside phosphotransferase domain-containing protein n=1 Tax=Glonium stellatum TaxID=574774 RepID=A0A8E2F7F7_9PEZI|nr:hypothetical protein AOQ84DRAFT_171479 [Glonium stellatum]